MLHCTRGPATAFVLVVITLLAGCPRKDAVAPVGVTPPVSAGPKVALPDGGMRHTERLAVTGWSQAGAFWACSQRTAEFGQPGRTGRCLVVEKAGDAAMQHEFAEGAITPDAAREGGRPDAAPGRCRVLFEDLTGDPGLPAEAAAKATLYGPPAPIALDAWKPPRTLDGDYFAVETSFSPDGKRLAIVHTAVGVGEGERSAEVVSVEVRAAPDCR